METNTEELDKMGDVSTLIYWYKAQTPGGKV